MERIQVLIAKLKEQADQQADATEMLATLQLLQNELQNLQPVSAAPAPARRLGTSKVAVVMPAAMQVQFDKYGPKSTEPPVVHETEKVLVGNGSVSIVQENGQLDMVFDPMHEIPTLSNQVRSNYNHKNGEPESLNDKLRESKTELIEVLKETPVKDLRKAIGINDRFTFLKELFRGDDAMYERSIKTINNFNIFSEAEYWIARELKHKLGWDDSNATVKHFYQLVRRRFA